MRVKHLLFVRLEPYSTLVRRLRYPSRNHDILAAGELLAVHHPCPSPYLRTPRRSHLRTSGIPCGMPQ